MSGEVLTEEKEEIKPLSLGLYGRPFSSFSLHPDLLEALQAKGLYKTTVIQDLFLPVALQGRDVIVKAKRGSGKALGYLVVILDRLLREPGEGLKAVVLLSNVKRALEMSSLAGMLVQGLPVSLSPFASEERIPSEQFKAVEKGVNIVFTTPYWLHRGLKWRLFSWRLLKIIVWDEFEDLLAHYHRLLESLGRQLPPPGQRQGLIFLENLSYEILEKAYSLLDHPEELFLESGREDLQDLKLSLFHISHEEKLPLLLGLLYRKEWSKALIFLNQKSEAQELCDELKKIGLRAIFLKPDLGPELRLHFLKQFAKNEAQILIATDAGCRFIQQNNVSLVINYDLPETADEFRQRASKVQKGGEFITFCDEEGAFFIEALEKELGMKIPVSWPEPEKEWFLSPSEAREKFKHRRGLSRRKRSFSSSRRPFRRTRVY